MTLTHPERLEWLEARILELRSWVQRAWMDLPDWSFDGQPLPLGSPWPDRHGIRTLTHPEVAPPAEWPAGERRLALDLGGEGLVRVAYADGAQESFGLDVEHRSFPLRDEPFALEVTLAARLAFGAPNRDARLAAARARWIDLDLETFVLRLELVLELGRELGEHPAVGAVLDAARRALGSLAWPTASVPFVSRQADTAQLLNVWELPPHLEPRPAGLDAAAHASVVAASERLAADLEALRERFPPVGALLLTGHAHIDLAWRWPISETRLKVRRTLHTALGLLERHPEVTFNQSTAQYFAWLEEDDPELLRRVQDAVRDGRLETIGGMWVEPDLNMPAGESLARQLLYGQRYFERHFGVRHTVCWLPDCFGFTPGLPQLLRLAGIEGFFTAKLLWSETNPFPHELFWWEGLDGSRVLAHTFRNHLGGYNGRVAPEAALGTWRNHRDAAIHPESLLSVGYGDGGGGLTYEQADRAREMERLPVSPTQRFGRVDEYFARAQAAMEAAPDAGAWVGELYLERHRGTLTTQGRTKWLHRRAERDLVAAEALGSLAALGGGDLPESLEPQWRVLLRNEFHDILPGSSIAEVYADAERELGEVVEAAGASLERSLDQVAAQVVEPGEADAVLLVNPDLTPRPVRATLPDGTPVTAPGTVGGLEAAVLTDLAPAGALEAAPDRLENDLVRVTIAPDGTLTSVWDKRAGREVLAGRGNQVWCYVDEPRSWDAWDVDANYAENGEELLAVAPPEVVESGAHRAAVRVVRRFRDSEVVQELRLWAGSPRLDVHTRLDWHDRHRLLKARFPLAVRATHASFEAAFGVQERLTHRNTSWEQARFEVAGHRFADLSEPGYGVALLNDGRYGHHVLGSELGLSLLRSPIWPDPLADEGEHELTYALCPHLGGWLEGGVLAEAEDLNRPLLVRPVRAGGASVARPLALDGLPVALGALKALEDGGGLVLRVYEPQGARGRAELTLPPGWERDAELDLLEGVTGAPEAHLDPFQVRSWRLRRG